MNRGAQDVVEGTDATYDHHDDATYERRHQLAIAERSSYS
jgi:hypothetical protein